MWLFTTIGFFSVTKNPHNEEQFQVRARVWEDLVNLRTMYIPSLGPVVVKEHADYRYRAYVKKDDFIDALKRIAEDIDYYNFKSEVDRTQGRKRERLYINVWSTMLDAEEFLEIPAS